MLGSAKPHPRHCTKRKSKGIPINTQAYKKQISKVFAKKITWNDKICNLIREVDAAIRTINLCDAEETKSDSSNSNLSDKSCTQEDANKMFDHSNSLLSEMIGRTYIDEMEEDIKNNLVSLIQTLVTDGKYFNIVRIREVIKLLGELDPTLEIVKFLGC